MSDWCPWHVIIVEATDDGEEEFTVLHDRSCAFTVRPLIGEGESTTRSALQEFAYECFIQAEIDNNGFAMLVDADCEVPAWYRARIRFVESRTWEFAEIDIDYQVEQLGLL